MRTYINTVITWKQVAAFLLLCVWLPCRSACVLTPVLERGSCHTQSDGSHAVDESGHAIHTIDTQVCDSTDYGDHAENEHSNQTGSLPCCEDVVAVLQKIEVSFFSPVGDHSNPNPFTGDSEQFSVSCQVDLRLVNLNFYNWSFDLKHLHWILVGCGHFSQAPPNLLH